MNLKRLMCILGLHKWDEWRPYIYYYAKKSTPAHCYIVETHQTHRCSRCGYTQRELMCDKPLPGVTDVVDERPAGCKPKPKP